MRNTFLINGLIALLSLATVAQAQQRPKMADRTKPEELGLKVTNVKEYVYKKTEQGELKIYVHFPADWKESDKRPAIVFFFGGGWSGGTVEQFTTQATYFATRGMVTARADYRIKSRHKVKPDKCVEDAKSAVRWIRKNAEMLGVDPDRIVASGGSAGGHIAACAGITPGPESAGEDLSISSKPNAMVLFNPFLNFDNPALPGMLKRFGLTKELGQLISPTQHMTKDTPPALLMYGDKDRMLGHGKEFMAKSKELGNRAELYVAEGQRHSFFNYGVWTARTIVRADKFLASLGYVEGEPTLALSDAEDSSKVTREGEAPAELSRPKAGEKKTPDAGSQGERPRTRRGPSFQQITRRFDANKDGKVTKKEWTGPERMFARMDRNADGMITADDFKGQPATDARPIGSRRGRNADGVNNQWAPALKPVAPYQRKTFFSKAIGQNYAYLVYLPPSYEKEPQRRFPVVYFLHGRAGVSVAFVMARKYDALVRKGEAPEVILVAPHGYTLESFWCDSKDGRIPVETVVARDLVEHVDATYRTIARREGRIVEGNSMGGFGAAHLGFKYPDTFGGVSMFAAALVDVSFLQNQLRDPGSFAKMFGDAKYAVTNLPQTLARKNANRIRGRTHIRMVVGSNDNLLPNNEKFHKLLQELNINHGYRVVEGAGHSVLRSVNDPFDFWAKVFADLVKQP